MKDTKTNNLVQTWVSVTDVRGRTHLEARWIEAPPTEAPAHISHAA